MALDTKVIERVITIDASPETVFRLLTDPVQYVRWKGSLAELEPRRGGGFRVEFGSAKDIAAGKYVEVVHRPAADGIGDTSPSRPPRPAAGSDREPHRRLGLLPPASHRRGRGTTRTRGTGAHHHHDLTATLVTPSRR